MKRDPEADTEAGFGKETKLAACRRQKSKRTSQITGRKPERERPSQGLTATLSTYNNPTRSTGKQAFITRQCNTGGIGRRTHSGMIQTITRVTREALEHKTGSGKLIKTQQETMSSIMANSIYLRCNSPQKLFRNE